MADRMKSPAYEVLRASSRRLLLFIKQEIARQGGSVQRSIPISFASSARSGSSCPAWTN